MFELSEKLLKGVIIASLVISLGALMFAFFQNEDYPSITGFLSTSATGKGNVSFSIVSSTYIFVTQGVLNFTALTPGAVNQSNASGSTGSISQYIWIQNDGNVAINITINSEDSLFDSDTVYAGKGTPNDNTAGSEFFKVGCFNGTTASGGYGGDNCMEWYNGTYLAVNASAIVICSNVPYQDTLDNCTIGARIEVPEDEAAGKKQSVFTFVGSAAT